MSSSSGVESWKAVCTPLAACVAHRQVALAGHAEAQLGAVQHELVDEDLPAAARQRTTGCSRKIVARCVLGLSASAGSTYVIVRLPAHSSGSSITRTNAVGASAAVVASTGSGPRSNHASPGPSVCS